MICLSALALLTVTIRFSAPAAAQSPDLFVEVTPRTSSFFTDDWFSIRVLAAHGDDLSSVVVEFVSDGAVVWESPVGRMIAAPGSTTRDGRHLLTAGLGGGIDERFPPGVYQVRARAGTKVSAPSPPFSVEPWGQPKGGVQVSLTGSATVTSGERIPLTVMLRNVGSVPLRVPSGEAAFDCESSPFRFILSGAAPHSPMSLGLSGQRKDCTNLPRILLQAKETIRFDVDLTRMNVPGATPRPVRPLPGGYRIHVSVNGAFADTGDPLIWKEVIRSNSHFIDVK